MTTPTVHEIPGGPHARPAIIAHRYDCPSCGATYAEPCRLGGKFPQEYSHVSRHKVAGAAMWAEMEAEIAAGTSPISSISFAG